MATFSDILFLYSNDDKKFRKASEKYVNSIVKEFNHIINMGFEVKDLYMDMNGIVDIEARIGNDEYEMFLCLYHFPKSHQLSIFQIVDSGFVKQTTEPRVEFDLTEDPKGVASKILMLINPIDIAKLRLLRRISN